MDLAPPLILASTSKIRQKLLLNAGLQFECQNPGIDEGAIKTRMAEQAATEIAGELAHLKADAISRRFPGALVIGADQILRCGPELFDKPKSRDEARSQLLKLRNKPHELISSICCVQDGGLLWQDCIISRLTMRNFSDQFLEHHIEANAHDLTSSVGAYKLEHSGIQLFDKIEGDYFSILGLPLLPLLQFLRQKEVVAS
jgi:septum formation protein